MYLSIYIYIYVYIYIHTYTYIHVDHTHWTSFHPIRRPRTIHVYSYNSACTHTCVHPHIHTSKPHVRTYIHRHTHQSLESIHTFFAHTYVYLGMQYPTSDGLVGEYPVLAYDPAMRTRTYTCVCMYVYKHVCVPNPHYD